MLLLDNEKGMAKQIQNKVFCHPVLERRKRVKIRERPEVKKTPPFLRFFGGP